MSKRYSKQAKPPQDAGLLRRLAEQFPIPHDLSPITQLIFQSHFFLLNKYIIIRANASIIAHTAKYP